MPKNHPLAEKETLTLGELKDESFCFLRDEKGGYEKEYRECIMNGFLPECEFVTTNAFYKLRYVMENEVFGFVPSSWKDVYERCADVVLIPQAGKQNEVRCKLGWSDMTLNSETNRKFLEFVKERLSGEQPG